MLAAVQCPFCDHEMVPGRIDAEGVLGWHAFLSVVWKTADRRSRDWERLSGFFRRRAANLCDGCGTVVLPPIGTGAENR